MYDWHMDTEDAKTMRRQNHSCDQCRKAKRACDAPSLRNGHIRGTSSSPRDIVVGHPEILSLDSDNESTCIPCSNCLKTRKRCTLIWARSQLKPSESVPSLSSSSGRNKRQRTDNETISSSFSSHSEPSTSDIYGSVEESTVHSQQIPSLESSESSLWYHAIAPIDPTLQSQSTAPTNSDNFFYHSRCLVSELDESIVDNFDLFNDFPFNNSYAAKACFVSTPETDITSHGLQRGETRAKSSALDCLEGLLPSIPDDPNIFPISNVNNPLRATRRQQSSSPALSSIESAMVATTNNEGISQNLLQIYHDVLEHNLSCWLTGETCPYKGGFRLKGGSVYAPRLLSSPVGASVDGMAREHHEEKWTNRIYHRVIQLDRIAQAAGLIRLTKTENQKAQKVLHLVIMAFATQWAYNSQRQRETYTTDVLNAKFGSLPEEFDRHLQRSLWEQARSALQDCADVESYRIVCAELIFGLTQRPWEEDEISEWESSDVSNHSHSKATNLSSASILPRIRRIMAKEGPPVFMERAVRKMHALKFKFDGHEAGLFRTEDGQSDPIAACTTLNAISALDRETVGLLYWLAVMFDTISSSMNERPVVVADEDSQHDAAEVDGPEDQTQRRSSHDNRRWRIDLFIQDNPERSSRTPLRWPCSYDEAASMVTRSAPVKVLLYRYVHYLQIMIRTPKRIGQPIEGSIGDALLVYKYWNTTYGTFFRDLVEQYPSVPAGIRGWFVCIVAHWHLASLMLADLIEIVNDNGLGLPDSTQERLNDHIVTSIRKSSAGQLSDLARIATPSGMNHTQVESQLPGFHLAVREGTILTEPWTMILIRAFTKAAMLHLQEAAEIEQQNKQDILGHGTEMLQSCLRKCEECIRALWFLGKKSDMARNVAIILREALNTSRG